MGASKDLNQNRLILFRDCLFSYVIDDDLIEKLITWKEGSDNDLKLIPLSNQNYWSIVELIHASKKYNFEAKYEPCVI